MQRVSDVIFLGCSVVIMAYDVTYLFPVCVKFIVEEAKVMTPIYLFSRSFFLM